MPCNGQLVSAVSSAATANVPASGQDYRIGDGCGSEQWWQMPKTTSASGVTASTPLHNAVETDARRFRNIKAPNRCIGVFDPLDGVRTAAPRHKSIILNRSLVPLERPSPRKNRHGTGKGLHIMEVRTSLRGWPSLPRQGPLRPGSDGRQQGASPRREPLPRVWRRASGRRRPRLRDERPA